VVRAWPSKARNASPTGACRDTEPERSASLGRRHRPSPAGRLESVHRPPTAFVGKQDPRSSGRLPRRPTQKRRADALTAQMPVRQPSLRQPPSASVPRKPLFGAPIKSTLKSTASASCATIQAAVDGCLSFSSRTRGTTLPTPCFMRSFFSWRVPTPLCPKTAMPRCQSFFCRACPTLSLVRTHVRSLLALFLKLKVIRLNRSVKNASLSSSPFSRRRRR